MKSSADANTDIVRDGAGTTGPNTRIRLITCRAYGFHSATPVIGLAMLSFAAAMGIGSDLRC